MSEREKKSGIGVTRLSWDTLNLHWPYMLMLLVAVVAVRAVSWMPLYLLITQRRTGVPTLGYGALWLLFTVFLVLPSRFNVHPRLRHLISGTRYSPVVTDSGRVSSYRAICSNADSKGVYPTYFHCLRFALYRLLYALVWGLPFMALTAFWCYGFWRMNANEFLPILGKISAFFGGTYYDLGTAVYFAAIALSGLLFLYGWNRGLVLDYTRIVARKDKRALQVAREVTRGNRKRIFLHTLSQIPYCVPPLLAIIAVLYNYVRAGIDFSKPTFALASSVMEFIKTPLSGETVTTLLLVLIVLNAPLSFFRRIRSAAFVYGLYGDRAEKRRKEKREVAREA